MANSWSTPDRDKSFKVTQYIEMNGIDIAQRKSSRKSKITVMSIFLIYNNDYFIYFRHL